MPYWPLNLAGNTKCVCRKNGINEARKVNDFVVFLFYCFNEVNKLFFRRTMLIWHVLLCIFIDLFVKVTFCTAFCGWERGRGFEWDFLRSSLTLILMSSLLLLSGAICCYIYPSIPIAVHRLWLSKRIYGVDRIAWSHVSVFILWFLQTSIQQKTETEGSWKT